MAESTLASKAIAFLEKARKLSPNRVEIREQLAEAYLQDGNREGALEETLAAADLLAETDPVSARATLRRAIQISPDSVAALQKLATLALEAGAQGEWAELMERAAQVCLQSQRKGEACRLLQSILDILPDSVETRRRLIDLQSELGSEDETIADRLSLASSLETKGDYTKALEEYAKVLESSPNNVVALEQTVELATRTGQSDKAFACAMKLGDIASSTLLPRESEPADPEAHQRAVREHAGRIKEAADWYDRAGKMSSEDPLPRRKALDCLLLLIKEKVDQPEPRTILERVRDLTDAYRKAGLSDEAGTVLGNVVALFPGEKAFQEEKARHLADSGKTSDSVGVYIDLGNGCGDNWKDAVENFEAALDLSRKQDSSPSRELESARLLANALVKSKNNARAVELYLRYAEQVREDSDWFDRQQSPRAAGEETLDLCLKAREIDSGLPVLRALAQAYVDAGQEASAADICAEIASQHVLRADQEPSKKAELFKKALASLERADEYNPSEPAYLESAAELKVHLGDAHGAARTWLELAERLCEQGRKEEAAAILQHCDLLDITEPEVFADIGRLLRTAEDTSAAIFYRRAGQGSLEEKAYVVAYGHLETALEIHLSAGDDSESAAQWETEAASELVDAAKASGDVNLHRNALRTVRSLWRDRNRTEDLIAVLEELIELDPDDREAREEHCRALESAGNKEKAAAACLELGDWLFAREESEEALRQIQRARSLGATGRNLAERLARAYQSAGRHAEAAEECGRLAQSLAEEGNRDEALAFCREALNLADDNTHLRARIVDVLDSLGDAEAAAEECAQLASQYLENRLVDRAIEVLRRACELDPSRTDTRRRLAEVYTREKMTRPAVDEFMLLYAQLVHLGKADQGREVLRKILAIEPDHLQARHALAEQIWFEGDKAGAIEALLTLANHLLEKGELDKALVAVDEAGAIDPKNRVFKKGAKEIRKSVDNRRKRLSNTEKIGQAQKLMERGELEKSIEIYESILGEGEDHEALIGLGRACWAQGERERAEEYFVQAVRVLRDRGALRQAATLCWDILELDRRSEPVLAVLAELDEESGSPEKAVDTRLNLGDVQAEKGETARALATYEQALELIEKRAREDPTERIPYGFVTAKMALARLLSQEKRGRDAAAHLLELGDIYSANQDVGEACTVLRHAVRVCPDDAEIRERYARSLLTAGQQAEALKELHAAANLHAEAPDRALPLLQEILRVNPEDTETRTTLARIYSESGQSEAAAREHRLLAAAEERAGNRTSALQHRRRIVELQPDDLPTRLAFAEEMARVGSREEAATEYLAAGEIYLKQKTPGKAIEVYRKAAELSNDPRSIRERIADILLSQGDRDKAVNEWILLGDACQREGNYDEASRFFNKILEAEPRDTRALSKQASCLLAAGEHSRASDVYARIADVYTERGILGKATEILSTALERFPASAELREKLGLLYEMRGMNEVAQREYEKALEGRPMDPQLQARLRKVSGDTEPEEKTSKDTKKKKADTGIYLFGGSGSLSQAVPEEQAPVESQQANREKGLDYFQRKRYARAVPSLESALAEYERGEQHDRPMETVNALAVCYLETNRNNEAIKILKRYLTLPEFSDEDSVETQYLLGIAYQKEDKPNEALAAWKSVYAKNPNYRDIQERILWSKRKRS